MSNQVAVTILEQIGGNRFVAMTGAKNLVAGKDSLSMKIGRNAKGVNHVTIRLNADDLYDITFGSIRGANYKIKSKAEGVFADMLCEVFEDHTGLYTSL